MHHHKAVKLTKKIYARLVDREWNRLDQDRFRRLEFDMTLRYLKKYLPSKGLILDAGGGPGRYTIDLAKKGYDIVLLDLTPANIAMAQDQIIKAKVGKRVKCVCEGNITDLTRFKSGTFDAVICLGGPLSHVSPETSRIKAVSELLRVAKRNAPVFVSVMSKYGIMSQGLRAWQHEIGMKTHFTRLVTKGDDHHWHGKYYCHMFTREELLRLFKKAKVLETVGLEGLSSPAWLEVNTMPVKRWKIWLEAHYKLCTQPTVVDVSCHILIIAKK